MDKKEQPLVEKTAPNTATTSAETTATAPFETEICVIPSSHAMSAPSYQALDRDSDVSSTEQGHASKTCRICLESDYPDDMIAPCRCKGSSRWVHRQCLDQWRIHETDRAFSKCTECLFEYHLETSPHQAHRFRKTKYYLMVMRDLCGVHLVVQLVIVALAWLASIIDEDRTVPHYINPDHPVGVYYLVGFLTLLCSLGIFGTMYLCGHGCSIKDALEEYPELGQARTGEQASYEARSSHYQQARRTASRHRSNQQQQQRQQHRSNNSNCCTCCFYSPPSPHYTYVYYGGGDSSCCDGCCWCCNGESVGGQTTPSSSQGGDGCGGNEGCGDEAGGILLIILLVVAAIMAAVGFLVGIMVVVIIFQRTVQRHAYLIHKQQLTHEFQVVDLSTYDLDQPLMKTTEFQDEEEAVGHVTTTVHPPPSAPPLPEEDTVYLKNMGLL